MSYRSNKICAPLILSIPCLYVSEQTTVRPCLGLFHVLAQRPWWKVLSSRAARVGQEVKSKWKVSEVRQMLVQWTVDRMCACPFMVILRITVALMISHPSVFFDIGLWSVVGNDNTHLFGSSRGSPWSPSHQSPRWIIIRLIYIAHCITTSDPHPSYCSCLRVIFC